MTQLTGQVAVIVGASSGMGRAIALAFAEQGAATVICARRLKELQTVARQIEEGGGQVLACQADVSKRPEVETVVAAAIERYGRLDVLVNAAGVNIRNRQMAVLQQEDWERILAINLTGAFNCTQAVLPQMRQQKNGLIIHITSISAKWADTSGPAYSASKHGIVGLAYATMYEERLNGIRITLIFPGLCDTPLLNNRPVPPSDEQRQQMMQPEDIAQACVFVASLPPRTYVAEMIMMPPALQTVGKAVA